MDGVIGLWLIVWTVVFANRLQRAFTFQTDVDERGRHLSSGRKRISAWVMGFLFAAIPLFPLMASFGKGQVDTTRMRPGVKAADAQSHTSGFRSLCRAYLVLYVCLIAVRIGVAL